MLKTHFILLDAHPQCRSAHTVLLGKKLSYNGQERVLQAAAEYALEVEMSASIQDSVNSFFAQEAVKDYEWAPSIRVTVQQQNHLTAASDVLIIVLKRYGINKWTGESWKDRRLVDLSRAITVPVDSMDWEYHLQGIIKHEGDRTDRGHYTSYTRRGDHWVYSNDSCVKDLETSELPQGLRRDAYVLFYRYVNRVCG